MAPGAQHIQYTRVSFVIFPSFQNQYSPSSTLFVFIIFTMSHLLVIIDCSPSNSVNQRQFIKWLDSVVTFCNSHLMLDEKNQLTIIGSFITSNKIILATDEEICPSKNIIAQQGQFEKFAFVTDIIRNGIVDLMKNSPLTVNNDCLLASALGMALCKINKSKKLPPRILVVSCSMQISSYSPQYMNLMNSFFASQKMNVPIDGCVFMKEDGKRGSVLEQGCDLTGGHFLNIPDISGNLEYLLWIFLPSTSIRETLLLPERRKATHRAACFCHRNIIDIGYVCSVCLSIFCTFSPICSSCQTHFKLNLSTKVISKLSNSSSCSPGTRSQASVTNSKTQSSTARNGI